MWIYIFQILCILIGMFVPMSNNKRNKKIYCGFVTIVFIFICGLRSKYMGPLNSWGVTDAQNVHIPAFLAAATSSWEEIFRGWISGDSNFRDIASCVFYKIISIFSNSEQFFLFIACTPLFITISRFIYIYSPNPVMSYFLVLGLNYFTGSMYLIRHMLAVTVVIIAYDFLYKKEMKKFVITVLIAALFHKTAIVVLILYPLAKVKWGIKQILIIIFGLFVGLFGNKVWNLMLKTIVSLIPMWSNFISRDFVNQFGQTWFISIMILFVVLMQRKKLYIKDEYMTTVELNMLTIGCFFYGIMSLLSEFSRIALFFMIAAIACLPKAVMEFKGNNERAIRRILSIGIYVAFGTYYIFGLTKAAGALPYILYNK